MKLQSLGLSFNNISDRTLSDLRPLNTVESLGISYCLGVTDAGLRSGTLQGMAHLKALNLRGLKAVTDASFDDMVKLGHLEHINIRGTKTSPDCVERLKKAMPKTVVFK
jgi:hypothetical protein